MSKKLSLQQAAVEIDLDLIEGAQYRKLDVFSLTKEGRPKKDVLWFEYAKLATIFCFSSGHSNKFMKR